MTCSICATIPETARANTGRDQHFEAPITSLRQRGLDRDDDLWECPECGAVFLWHDDRAFTGSGNNDEEVLTRLPEADASVVRAFIHRGDRAAEEVAREAARWIALPTVVRTLVSRHVQQNDRELARHLVPPLLDELSRGTHGWTADFVTSYASSEEGAQVVVSELARRPANAELHALRAHCKRTLCSVCRPIKSYPSVTAHRDRLPAPLGLLTQIGASRDLDAWECPECDSMFLWEAAPDAPDGEGTLSRLSESSADALRACLHREGVVSDHAVQMVFASDKRRSLRIALAHGMRSDQELVRQLVPRMVLELVLNEPQWLYDLLCAFAAEPSNAAVLLDAIARSTRTNALVASLAARCR